MLARARLSLIFAFTTLPLVAANKPATPNAQVEKQTPAEKGPIPEKLKFCQQYEGKYLAYYDAVFVVKGCVRFSLDGDEVYALMRAKTYPQEDPNIAMIIQTIPLGGKWRDEQARLKSQDPCTAYDKAYVTDGVEVYWIKSCELRQFPDWATYEDHRGSLGKNPPNLRYLDKEQFKKFKWGKPLPSVIIQEYRELDQSVTKMPLADACRGIVGKTTSYLDTLYYIEATKGGCRRREIDSEEYTRSRGKEKYYLQELTSSQVISIPLGKKYNKK